MAAVCPRLRIAVGFHLQALPWAHCGHITLTPLPVWKAGSHQLPTWRPSLWGQLPVLLCLPQSAAIPSPWGRAVLPAPLGVNAFAFIVFVIATDKLFTVFTLLCVKCKCGHRGGSEHRVTLITQCDSAEHLQTCGCVSEQNRGLLSTQGGGPPWPH